MVLECGIRMTRAEFYFCGTNEQPYFQAAGVKGSSENHIALTTKIGEHFPNFQVRKIMGEGRNYYLVLGEQV